MLDHDEFTRVTDLIYEAAAVPELWPRLLDLLSARIDGVGGVLFTANVAGTRWTASSTIQPLFDDFVRTGWHARNPRPQRLASANHAGFVRDNDFFTEEEMAADPVYRDIYRKNGLGWATGTMLQVPSGDAIIFSFEKAHAKGVVDLQSVAMLDTLRPHLARAALLGAHFGLEKARAMAEALAASGLPAAVLRGRGRLYAANARFEALIPDLLVDAPQRLAVTDSAADRLFSDALGAVLAGGASAFSIPVRAQAERKPHILHLIPIRRAANDIFDMSTALLIVTPVDRGVVPSADVLAGLFDLTAGEARIARAIAQGETVDSAAASAGISRETVRTHLKHVLAKVGVSRQADLVALLSGAAFD